MVGRNPRPSCETPAFCSSCRASIMAAMPGVKAVQDRDGEAAFAQLRLEGGVGLRVESSERSGPTVTVVASCAAINFAWRTRGDWSCGGIGLEDQALRHRVGGVELGRQWENREDTQDVAGPAEIDGGGLRRSAFQTELWAERGGWECGEERRERSRTGFIGGAGWGAEVGLASSGRRVKATVKSGERRGKFR